MTTRSRHRIQRPNWQLNKADPDTMPVLAREVSVPGDRDVVDLAARLDHLFESGTPVQVVPAPTQITAFQAVSDIIEAGDNIIVTPNPSQRTIRISLDNFDAGKVTSGVLDDARISDRITRDTQLPGALQLVPLTGDGVLVAETAPGVIGQRTTAFGDVPLANIPELPASRTTSGIFDVLRIPDLDAAKITTGTIDNDRLNLAQAVIPELDASKITTGLLDDDRLSFNIVRQDQIADFITADTLPTDLSKYPEGLMRVENLFGPDGRFELDGFTLNNSVTGTPSATSNAQLVIDRGELPNTALVWDESETKFQVVVPADRLARGASLMDVLHTGSDPAIFPDEFHRIARLPDAASGQAGQGLLANQAQDGDYAIGDTRLVPAGGTTGQILAKNSDADFDVAWKDDEAYDPRLPQITSSAYSDHVLISTGLNYRIWSPNPNSKVIYLDAYSNFTMEIDESWFNSVIVVTFHAPDLLVIFHLPNASSIFRRSTITFINDSNNNADTRIVTDGLTFRPVNSTSGNSYFRRDTTTGSNLGSVLAFNGTNWHHLYTSSIT